jgi:hypothetical protein
MGPRHPRLGGPNAKAGFGGGGCSALIPFVDLTHAPEIMSDPVYNMLNHERG